MLNGFVVFFYKNDEMYRGKIQFYIKWIRIIELTYSILGSSLGLQNLI